MRKIVFYLFFWLLLCPVLLKAQTTHMVQRGETFSLIASRYGISEEQLRKANPLCDECYVGMSLTILQSDIEFAKSEKIELERKENEKLIQEELNNAISLATSGEYKKAIKKYDLLIEKNPIAELYMMRGKCQYERGKWKRSIEDFEYALTLGGLSSKDCLETKRYLKKAKEFREEQLNNRANTWAGIAGIAVATTVAVVQASNTRSSSNSSSGSMRNNTISDSTEEIIEEKGENVKVKKECPICHGTGKTVEHTANYGIANEKYCEECDKMVIAGHYHKNCSYCSGKGYR